MTDVMKSSMVPLAEASLCCDCHTISDSMRECPACGSSALLGLAIVLNRREPEEGAALNERTAGE